MARLSAPFSLSGTFGQLVAVRRKDLSFTLVRAPTSITRKRFLTDPAFTNSRRTATEGGGRSKAAQALRRVLQPLAPVRDHNWQGALTGALTAVQYQDTASPWGQRSVLLSRHGYLLEGYALSRRTPLEGLVRAPLTFHLDKSTLRARVELPELIAHVNLAVRPPEPYFRVVAALGAVCDMSYTPGGYAPEQEEPSLPLTATYTEWRPVKSGAPAQGLALHLSFAPSTGSFALVLAVGLLLGTPGPGGTIQALPYRGGGKILKVE